MARTPNKGKSLSRRGILPILGSALLLPFTGFNQYGPVNKEDADQEDYQTLLRPDGTTVKVKVADLKKSKIVKKKMSNTDFRNWLGKKDGLL